MFSSTTPNDQLNSPNVPTSLSEFKLKRDEYSVEIRKQKRDEYLKKIRNSNIDLDKKIKVGGYSTLSGAFDTPQNSELRKCITEWLNRSYQIEEFFDLVNAINSDDRYKQHFGMIGLRKLLAQDNGPPIQHAIDQGLVPILIKFTQLESEPHLQMEAAWALTNIASGTTQQTQVVIENEGIQCFIYLLRSEKVEVVEQAIWALGNIAGDCHQFRDVVLKYGALQPLVEIIQNSKQVNIIKHGIWALSNLCRGRPLPEFETVNPALMIFTEAIQMTTDSEVLTDATWALSFLSDGDAMQIQRVLETGVLPAIVNHLETQRLSSLVPMIRIIGNLTAGEDIQTDAILQVPNLMQNLYKLLNHTKKVVRRETCWALSNITVGNERHIEAVLSSTAMYNKLISMALAENSEVKREATWALSNATYRCTIDQLIRMLQYGLMECFCSMLHCEEDAKTLEVALDGLNNIIKKGIYLAKEPGGENPLLFEFEQKGGVEKLEKLQQHKSVDAYEAAMKFLSRHFELEDA